MADGSLAVGAAADEPLRPLLAAVPNGTLLLLERTDCAGAFLLPLLVRAALQDGHRVIIIAAAHSPARHAAALRRLGIVHQLKRGDVTCVRADGGGGAGSPQQQQQQALAHLLRRVAAEVARVSALPAVDAPAPKRGGVTVALDSLPALLALAGPTAAATPHAEDACGAAFIAGCRALGVARANGLPYRFAVLAASDVEGSGSGVGGDSSSNSSGGGWGPALPSAPLLRGLAHAADLELRLSPVEGRTAALDGRLDATLRRGARRQAASAEFGGGSGSGGGMDGSSTLDEPGSTAMAPGKSAWHFRVTDVGVRWLPDCLDGREVLSAA